MYRLWIIFAQTATVCLAVLFVVSTLKPEWLPSRGPTLGVANASAPHFDLAWRRCLPNGCFADVAVGSELLKLLRGRTEPMQIDFRDAGEREVKLPLSMRGLVPALDALAKEPH